MRLRPTILIIGLIAYCLLLTADFSKAQVIKGAAIAGFNLSQVDGDEVYGFYKVGLNIGAAAIWPLSDKFEFTIETIYSQKGSYQKPQYNDSLSGEYKLKLNYLEVPVLFHYNDKNIVSFGLGLSWGRLTGVEEYEHGRLVTTTTLQNGPYSLNDFDALFDIRFRIWKRLKGNVRYCYSIAPIRTREFHPPNSNDSWTRYQFNNFWTFRLIYVFNEVQSERIRKENTTK
jgi:hypothetical protein